jgi:hypothetical protein
MIELTYKPLRYKKRWFAYLDLLGFTNLVETNSIQDVLPVYAEALNQMRRSCYLGKAKSGLISSWFSDTFIIYTKSDSLEDFAHLESAARIFFQLLIIKKIPVRGCISHGNLYSQARQNIFIGPALIEAHKYGEALDWVGFCLAPSVEKELKETLPLGESPFYRKVSKKSILRNLEDPYVYAYAFNNGSLNGNNPFLGALHSMRASAPKIVKHKYNNTLDFIENA